MYVEAGHIFLLSLDMPVWHAPICIYGLEYIKVWIPALVSRLYGVPELNLLFDSFPYSFTSLPPYFVRTVSFLGCSTTGHLKTQQTTLPPKIKLGGWTSVKPELTSPQAGKYNKRSEQKKVVRLVAFNAFTYFLFRALVRFTYTFKVYVSLIGIGC